MLDVCPQKIFTDLDLWMLIIFDPDFISSSQTLERYWIVTVQWLVPKKKKQQRQSEFIRRFL